MINDNNLTDTLLINSNNFFIYTFVLLLTCVVYPVTASGAIEYKYQANSKVLVYSPSYTYGGDEIGIDGLMYLFDESDDMFNGAKFFEADLPPEKMLKDNDATLDIVESFGDYGTVIIHTHGLFWQTDESLDDWKVGIAGFRSGTDVKMPPLQRDPKYLQDLENFRLAISRGDDAAGRYQYVVMPSYIDKYVSKLNDTFFLLNYCHSLQTDHKFTLNNMMWNVLKEKGAKVAFGYSEEYFSRFGHAMSIGIPATESDEDDLNERNEYGILHRMLPGEDSDPFRPYPHTAAEAFHAIPEEQRISYHWDADNDVNTHQKGIFQKKVASPEWDNLIFLTPKLEISPPDQYVYAAIDGSIIDNDNNTQYIHSIKAKVRNTTLDEEMLNGSLVAVAKYKKYSVYSPYQPDLSSGAPSIGMREENFSYSRSAPVEISSLSSTTPEEFTFDFTDSPIPAGITDLYLQVVFKVTFGNEEHAVAFGMKDLNEPMHIVFWNYSDYFQYNGIPMTAEEMRRDHPTIETVAYIYPFPFTETIGFSRYYPDTVPDAKVVISELPPARYSRIIIITDGDDTSFYLTDNVTAYYPPNTPELGIPDVNETWKYTFPTAVHQGTSQEDWVSTSVYRGRGIIQHQNTYFINAYPYMTYINNLPAPVENSQGPYPATIVE